MRKTTFLLALALGLVAVPAFASPQKCRVANKTKYAFTARVGDKSKAVKSYTVMQLAAGKIVVEGEGKSYSGTCDASTSLLITEKAGAIEIKAISHPK